MKCPLHELLPSTAPCKDCENLRLREALEEAGGTLRVFADVFQAAQVVVKKSAAPLSDELSQLEKTVDRAEAHFKKALEKRGE